VRGSAKQLIAVECIVGSCILSASDLMVLWDLIGREIFVVEINWEKVNLESS